MQELVHYCYIHTLIGCSELNGAPQVYSVVTLLSAILFAGVAILFSV